MTVRNMSNEQHYSLLTQACVVLVFLLQIYQVNGMECGTVNLHRSTIIGGTQVFAGEWPFIAALFHKSQSEFFCGGTIISNRHVLTAAHCITLKHSGNKALADGIEVRLGAYNLTTKNEPEVIFRNVTEIHVHSDWDAFEDKNEAYDADIAILVLSDNVTFTNYIRPICLPSDSDNIDGGTVNVTGKIVGWGLSESLTHEEVPRQAFIKTLNDSYCYRRHHGMVSLASARTFCGVYGDGTPGEGDSGGGLFVTSGAKWVQYGIISSSTTNRIGRIDKNSISLYTNVKYFKDWIEKVLSSERVESATLRSRIETQPSGSNRISAQKCNEYAEFAYNRTYTVSVSGPVRSFKTSNCASYKPLLVGGIDAIPREFPHMALIEYGYENHIQWNCGGTLISEQFVLSTAGCAIGSNRTGPAAYVRLGQHYLHYLYDRKRPDDNPLIRFHIVETFFNENVPTNTYKDIALLKLEGKVEFNDAIRPACLPQHLAVPNTAIATGWGILNRSNTLQKVDLEIFSSTEVLNDVIRRIIAQYDNETIVLAGHHTERRDTCKGDTGGPLQILHETHHCTYTLIGVTSIGLPGKCGMIDTPAIYTRVYNHLSWIEETVWPNEEN